MVRKVGNQATPSRNYKVVANRSCSVFLEREEPIHFDVLFDHIDIDTEEQPDR